MINISIAKEVPEKQTKYYFSVRHIPTGMYLTNTFDGERSKEPVWYLLTSQNKSLTKKYLSKLITNRLTKAYDQVVNLSCCSCGSCEPNIYSAEVIMGKDLYDNEIYISTWFNTEITAYMNTHIESLNIDDVTEVRVKKPLSEILKTSKYELDFEFKRIDIILEDICE